MTHIEIKIVVSSNCVVVSKPLPSKMGIFSSKRKSLDTQENNKAPVTNVNRLIGVYIAYVTLIYIK